MNVLVTERELQYGSVNFLVYLFNSFEQVPVPGVTENRYLTVRRTRGWLSEGRNCHVHTQVVVTTATCGTG